jgi:hypothetical protein
MSRSSVLIVLGVLTMLAPFSGLPGPLRTLLAVGFGAAVLGIGLSDRVREQRRLLADTPATPPPASSEPPQTISAI